MLKKRIDEQCFSDDDCDYPTAECVSSCNRYLGLSAKVCKCRKNFFKTIDYIDNKVVCR
jgi:hypothetical protein